MLVRILAHHGSCLGGLAIDASKWQLRPRQIHKFCGSPLGVEVVRLHLTVFFNSPAALSDHKSTKKARCKRSFCFCRVEAGPCAPYGLHITWPITTRPVGPRERQRESAREGLGNRRSKMVLTLFLHLFESMCFC